MIEVVDECFSVRTLLFMTNRMRLIPQTDLDDIVKLARAAMRLHEGVTHYGKCDICDLVTKWRRLRDDSTSCIHMLDCYWYRISDYYHIQIVDNGLPLWRACYSAQYTDIVSTHLALESLSWKHT